MRQLERVAAPAADRLSRPLAVDECLASPTTIPNATLREAGVVEALDRAKAQGKVRFVGFTGHKDPHIHFR